MFSFCAVHSDGLNTVHSVQRTEYAQSTATHRICTIHCNRREVLSGIATCLAWLQGGSRNGASLAEEAHCNQLRGRAPLLRALGYKRKALETGISLHGGSVGQPEMDSSTGDLEMAERGSGVGASMGALRRNPGGRAPLLGTLEDR
jgi:hypothetical protein